jgi:hypothetical protein
VEKFGMKFSASNSGKPECRVLSSAAMVTAAKTVQEREKINHEGHEGNHCQALCAGCPKLASKAAREKA